MRLANLENEFICTKFFQFYRYLQENDIALNVLFIQILFKNIMFDTETLTFSQRFPFFI